MKENIDKLIKTYEAGESSLAEEMFLKDHAEEINHSHKPWFKYIQRNKHTAPQQFNTSIWEAIQRRRKNKQRLSIGILTAAASVAILLSVFIINPQKNRLSYQEKEAILNEALSMFNAHNTTQQQTQNVLYEDDMIVIYLEQE
ncbi:hypothetical protein ACE01N_04640 [Saccharicrinis sp. FJH2]|uniref:hypothetical protein n=1 Tax=Saccharicrinis sp. FJH65 TaxID=3344659 RepID=UPI0035F4E2E9